MVNPDEFHAALLCGPVRLILSQFRQVPRHHHSEQENEIFRDFMVETVTQEFERDDAFFTLPFTILFFLTFVLVVMTHLRMFERQQVESSLELWTGAWGE